MHHLRTVMTLKKIPEENCCDCPPRQNPPPIPTALPFPYTEENREKLEQWLLDYYKGSTFNIYQHQKLPMMSGLPMRLLIEDDATPVAYYTMTEYSFPPVDATKFSKHFIPLIKTSLKCAPEQMRHSSGPA